jgi:hypothetical protein
MPDDYDDSSVGVGAIAEFYMKYKHKIDALP